MKITIELEGSGVDARQQLINFLYGEQDPNAVTYVYDKKVVLANPKDEAVENNVNNVDTEKTTGIVKETRTRKTKAQLEAEKATEPAKNESAKNESGEGFIKRLEGETNDGPFDESKPAETTSKVTIPDLQKKSVELGRSGKRDAVKEILNKYGAESFTSTKPLAPEHFDAVMEELEKL